MSSSMPVTGLAYLRLGEVEFGGSPLQVQDKLARHDPAPGALERAGRAAQFHDIALRSRRGGRAVGRQIGGDGCQFAPGPRGQRLSRPVVELIKVDHAGCQRVLQLARDTVTVGV